jgi:hypothetical protein
LAAVFSVFFAAAFFRTALLGAGTDTTGVNVERMSAIAWVSCLSCCLYCGVSVSPQVASHLIESDHKRLTNPLLPAA